MTHDLLKGFRKAADPYSKRGLESLTALFIFVFGSIFCHMFVVSLGIFDEWPSWLLYGAVSVVFYLVVVLIFSADVLYHGNPEKNKYVRAFQYYWPSRHIAERFGIPLEDARYYWFENYFNRWKVEDDSRHGQWERTLRRGYSCRFIYYCVRCLEILLWLSVLLTLGQETLSRVVQVKILRTNTGLAGKVAFIAFVALLYVIIRAKNRTAPADLGGVWKRYAEINKMHRKWIDENISSVDELRNPSS